MSSKKSSTPLGAGAGVSLHLLSAPTGTSTRVREPVKPTTGRVVGYFPSIKNNRSIAWESQLEQKACYVFEFSLEVAAYREQPLSINYVCDGKFLHYTPDFELTMVSGEIVYVEIKPKNKLLNQELQKKIIAITDYWKERNQKFIVMTDTDLNHPILQTNLKLLRSYLRIHCTPELIQISRHWLTKETQATFGNLTTYLDSINKVYALLAHQIIGIDLSSEITDESPVYLKEEFQG